MYTIGLAWCCHLLGQSLTLTPLEKFFLYFNLYH